MAQDQVDQLIEAIRLVAYINAFTSAAIVFGVSGGVGLIRSLYRQHLAIRRAKRRVRAFESRYRDFQS